MRDFSHQDEGISGVLRFWAVCKCFVLLVHNIGLRLSALLSTKGGGGRGYAENGLEHACQMEPEPSLKGGHDLIVHLSAK